MSKLQGYLSLSLPCSKIKIIDFDTIQCTTAAEKPTCLGEISRGVARAPTSPTFQTYTPPPQIGMAAPKRGPKKNHSLFCGGVAGVQRPRAQEGSQSDNCPVLSEGDSCRHLL